MSSKLSVLGDVQGFLQSIFSGLAGAAIDVSGLELDHLCYRTASTEEYERMKHELAQLGTQLTEGMIGGRLIATYRLRGPVIFEGRKVHCIELPSPKPGRRE